MSGADSNGHEVRLNDLYQEVILDHNRRPRNYGKMADANTAAHGVNPLCGDDFYLYLHLGAGGKIERVSFEGQGCAISKSSASMMTAAVSGKNVREAIGLKDDFIELLTKDEVRPESRARLGNLKIFEGVKQFPVRVKCATLSWRALEEALKDEKSRKTEVSTEH